MTSFTRQSRPDHRPLGFTLIEMIVAIGAVALIAVGIAAIFDSVGRTVSGGRRVSVLNQYASLIERQMRADFEAMTRDGVMVIRHQYANDGDPVQSTIDDANPRRRRIDELLFFVRGDYSSARSPIVPGLTAQSSEAMVVYSHGLRLDPIEDQSGKSIGGSRDPRYERPQVDDGGPARPYRYELALGNDDDPANPNRFASEWTLLRQQITLAPPSGSDQNVAPDADPVWQDLGLFRPEALDSEIQIGGQAAASSAFHTLAARFPSDYGFPPPAYIRGARNGDRDRRPMLASGIVDVASSDLAEIRRIITDAGVYPWDVSGETQLFNPANPSSSLLDDRYNHNSGGAGSALRFMHAWMDDLLPTDPATGNRTRYEPNVPDFVGTLSVYTDAKTRNYRFIQNFRLADQRALGSSIFVPRCTEFVVEYSFGQIVDDTNNPYYGQLVWFGLDRTIKVDGQDVTVVQPYPFDTTSSRIRQYAMPYTRLDGSTATRTLSPQMLYSVLAGGGPNLLTAHFGYTDPTYLPSDPDVDPATVPWPWPKLIRVTMTLADPTDPSLEQTFQFIFQTPEGRSF